MAIPAIENVTAPTLLIVGGDDGIVIDMNKQALKHLQCPKELIIIPGATHLFEEPGALEAVTEAAAAWYQKYLL
jgi:putative phosphoribosyl transferase